ncbi:MAG: hypothetical protein IJ826_03865 [Bacteroidaceae bacterium]|nr:hypothetical protein [Bacteroidaceae bacterium]
MTDIGRRIVLVGRCPSRYNGSDGPQPPLPIIRLAEYHKGSTPAPLHPTKLTELSLTHLAVGRWLLAIPANR